jgi:hypothetical protein
LNNSCDVGQSPILVEAGQKFPACDAIDLGLGLPLRLRIGEHDKNESAKRGDGRVGSTDGHGRCSYLDLSFLMKEGVGVL